MKEAKQKSFFFVLVCIPSNATKKSSVGMKHRNIIFCQNEYQLPSPSTLAQVPKHQNEPVPNESDSTTTLKASAGSTAARR